MASNEELPVRSFRTSAAWEQWLCANAGAGGIWLKIARKNSGLATLSYAEALDVALCHGWIDGQKKGFDDQYFLQRFTPRRSRSLWSQTNTGHVERLMASGRMQAGGQREVEAAKADGRWQAAYPGFAGMEVPEELADALKKSREAQAFFDTLDSSDRYSFCWRVHTAKKLETRIARAHKFVVMLARGEKLH